MTTWENGPPVTIAMAGVDYAWAYSRSGAAVGPRQVHRHRRSDRATRHARSPQLAPAGRWQIDLTYTGGLAAADFIHAWVRRDDHVYGFPLRGRQSYLDDPLYERFGYTGRFDHAGRDEEFDNAASLARRESTINSMATGRSAIVLGGYLGKEMRLAKYSAAGRKLPPLQPPDLPPRWPDAVAVSETPGPYRCPGGQGRTTAAPSLPWEEQASPRRRSRAWLPTTWLLAARGIEPWFETWRRRC